MEQLSKFHFFGVAIVAANKPLNTKEIECTPIENLPMVDGQISTHSIPYKSKSKDATNAVHQEEIHTTNTLKATWLPINGGNRFTAPDVRRGETVVLYRFADTDKYYWATLLQDSNLRKLETVIYGFSGTRDEGATPNADNTYFLEISSHAKLVHFHTSKADGEPFTYDVQINTGEGVLTIKDDGGNHFYINSTGTRIELLNASGSVITMDHGDINISSPSTISMSTGAMTISAGTLSISAQTTHNGNVNVNGNIHATGTIIDDSGNTNHHGH